MKVLALIERPNHVCYRYRIEAFAWALREQGLMLEAAPLGRSTLGRIGQFRRVRRAGVVILQRKLLPLWQLYILRQSARCLIYDVDDAVFHRDSYSRKPPHSRTRFARFWATVYAADAVIAGNPYLHDRVAGYVGPDAARLIPTCVESGRYPLGEHHRVRSSIRLAWIGGRSTMASLDRAKPQLAAVGDCLPGLELRVISDAALRLDGITVVPRTWSSANEAAELADCDVGINWLPDDPWSRGKCGLKVLQYMAAGLPVVANPVGMNRHMVVHGRTGLLATTPTEWREAIGRLAADPELRRSMGRAGRQLVEKRFGVAQWGPVFAATIAQAARQQTKSAHRDSVVPWDRIAPCDSRRGSLVSTP